MLLACKVMLNRNSGNNILELKERPSPIEKGVLSYRREPPFTSKKRPLCLLIVVSTPLSIRRGVGGEASPPFWGGCLSSLLAYAKMLKDIPQHLMGSNLSTGNIG